MSWSYCSPRDVHRDLKRQGCPGHKRLIELLGSAGRFNYSPYGDLQYFFGDDVFVIQFWPSHLVFVLSGCDFDHPSARYVAMANGRLVGRAAKEGEYA